MAKAYVCMRSVSVDHVVNFMMCCVETIGLSVSSCCVCVCCISRAGHTVCHVSLIRLSLAGLAASTEPRRAAQQGCHSPPTDSAVLPPQPTRLPSCVAARHSDGAELNQSLRKV